MLHHPEKDNWERSSTTYVLLRRKRKRRKRKRRKRKRKRRKRRKRKDPPPLISRMSTKAMMKREEVMLAW